MFDLSMSMLSLLSDLISCKRNCETEEGFLFDLSGKEANWKLPLLIFFHGGERMKVKNLAIFKI